MMLVYYVYEHWRSDTNVCFYVGKGKGNRAYWLDRGGHHGRIVRKLTRFGLEVEVRIVAGGLSEAAAFELERERIAFWRSAGVELTNRTDGGDGVSGFKHSTQECEKIRYRMLGNSYAKGHVLSSGTREKLRVLNLGKKRPMEHCARISAGLVGNTNTRGRSLTPEHREKIRIALLGKPGKKGYKHTAEAKERIISALIGRRASKETRAKISKALQGNQNSKKYRITVDG